MGTNSAKLLPPPISTIFWGKLFNSIMFSTHFGWLFAFLMFFFLLFLLICFNACFFFLLPLCFFFTCCLFRYLPGSGNEGMNPPPQGVYYREGPTPSMHPIVYPSSTPRTSNPTFYQHHRFTSSHPTQHQPPPPPQYGTLHHQGATRHQPPPPNVTVDTVSIMSVSGFLFGTGCSRQSWWTTITAPMERSVTEWTCIRIRNFPIC